MAKAFGDPAVTRFFRAAALVLAATAIVACGGRGYTVPPVSATPTSERHLGKWVWYDLLTHDGEVTERFYSELFGWEFDEPVDDDSPFRAISLRGTPIAGMFVVPEGDERVSRARWVPYVSVADVDDAVRFVEGQGGEVLAEAQNLEDRGRLAVVEDPQGAVFGVLHSTSGDPADLDAAPGGFLWTELWTRDVQEAVNFYHGLAGYSHVVMDFPSGGDYDVLQAEELPRAGVLRLPFEGVDPNWLPYVLVDDPHAIAQRVEELGGTVFLGPDEELRSGSVAIIIDPSGAALTIQQWPIPGEERRGFPQ